MNDMDNRILNNIVEYCTPKEQMLSLIPPIPKTPQKGGQFAIDHEWLLCLRDEAHAAGRDDGPAIPLYTVVRRLTYDE